MSDNARHTIDLEEQLTIVSTRTLHAFFQLENGADVLALYMFYYYTAKWQKTNSVFATKDYCLKGLNWGTKRFVAAKKALTTLELVEDVVRREEGKIVGWYVRLKYIWTDEKVIEASQYQKPSESKATSGSQNPNALSVIKENALSEINNISKTRKKNVRESTEGEYFPKLTKQKGWEIAMQYRVSMEDVKRVYDRVMDMVATGEMKESYPKHKDTNRTVRKWLSLQIAKGQIETLDEIGMMWLERMEPDRLYNQGKYANT